MCLAAMVAMPSVAQIDSTALPSLTAHAYLSVLWVSCSWCQAENRLSVGAGHLPHSTAMQQRQPAEAEATTMREAAAPHRGPRAAAAAEKEPLGEAALQEPAAAAAQTDLAATSAQEAPAAAAHQEPWESPYLTPGKASVGC
jgi:hypothetical protein